jgi:hypothetical protein
VKGASIIKAMLLAVAMAVVLFAIMGAGPAVGAPSVTCYPASPGPSGSVLLIITGGATSSSQPLQISVSGGDYVFDLGSSSACAETFAVSDYPNVTVDSATEGQYVVLDDSNGDMASHTAGCPVQVRTTGEFSGTLELDGAPVGTAGNDATIGIGSSAATLSEGGCASDVTPGASTKTLVVNGGASANTLDLSNASGPLTVDASASPQKVTGFSGGNVTEVDFANEQTVLGPSTGSTKFVAGATGMTFTGQGSGNSLDLSAVATSQAAPATVNVSGNPVSVNSTTIANNTASAGGGAVIYSFTDVSAFKGPTTGNTTFVSGSGSHTFTVQGSANTLDLSAAGTGLTIDAHAGSAKVGTHTDTFGGITTFVGSALGSTTFVPDPSSSNEVFTGGGNANTLDLSPLTAPKLNVSGATTSGIANNSALAGTSTYHFTDVAKFKGASSGSTTFYAPTSAGDTFTGQGGTGNTLSFASDTASSATLDANAGTATIGTSTQQFSGMQTLVGLSGGNTTFVPGTGGGQTFTATSGSNLLDVSPLTSPTVDANAGTISFGALSDSLSGISSFKGASTGHTTLIAPTTTVSFQGQGSGNELDISALSTSPASPAIINVSGNPADLVANDTATAGAVSDSFSDVSAFTGASDGQTTFIGGQSSDGFSGQGAANTLDLSAAGSPVKVDAHAGIATFGSATDQFSDISTFFVPSSGANTFVPGLKSATFFGGSGNTLDLSPMSGLSSLTVVMAGDGCPAGSVAVHGTGSAPIADCVAGASTIHGASAVPTTFQPDPDLTATPSPAVVFVGKDTKSDGSSLDLSRLTSPDAGGHTVSGLTASMNGDSSSSPGAVTANVDGGAVNFASFSGINEVIGSGTLPTAFEPGTTKDVSLVGIAKLAQSVRFTSSPPTSPTVGKTYVPHATGGNSGNFVVITTGTGSNGVCSISHGTVKFTGAGTCRLDANQAGNGEYTPAPQAQQAISVVRPKITSRQIRERLAKEIGPSKRLRIGALLKAGGHTLVFRSLEAGVAVVRWYRVPAGAHLARKRVPVLIGSGRLHFKAAGSRQLRLKLTAAGRALLRKSNRITLTAQGAFTPAGVKTVRATRTFTLKR